MTEISAIKEEYKKSLQMYLKTQKEGCLVQAFEIGKQGIRAGAGILDFVSIHSEAMLAILTEQSSRAESAGLEFFANSITPFEMTQKGYQEAIQSLKSEITRRKITEDALRMAHGELERKVQERTQDLLHANDLLTKEIAERCKAEEALREKTQYLEKLIEKANAPILVLDPSFRLIRVNHAAEQLSGRTATDLLGNSFENFVQPKCREHARSYLKKIIAGDLADTIEIPMLHPEGSHKTIIWSGAAIYGEDKSPIAVVFQGTDITERNRAEEERLLANRKLDLMNNVAYQDIQNKVTALRGYSELARNAETETERRSFLEKEEALLGSIHTVINKTKDYQKMGTNHPRWIELEPLIRHQASLISGIGGISVEVDLHGLECYADPEIDQVFSRLIDNSIRHGKTVTRISVSCLKTPRNAVIIYEDNGVGIPPGEKAGIFNRVVSGNGKFGLFFVREFLELSGMKIAETGIESKGARFEISVPKGKYRVGHAAPREGESR